MWENTANLRADLRHARDRAVDPDLARLLRRAIREIEALDRANRVLAKAAERKMGAQT